MPQPLEPEAPLKHGLWSLALATTLLSAAACDPLADPVIVPELDLAYSFDDGMEDWAAAAPGVESAAWSVAVSSAEAREGHASLRLALDAAAGPADLWIRRALEVAPGRLYTVEISFALATSDHAGVPPWTVLAGAQAAEPLAGADLVARDGTGSGLPAGQGVAWVEKRYTAQARSDDEGTLWVSVGVRAGTSEARAYLLDAMRLVLTRS